MMVTRSITVPLEHLNRIVNEKIETGQYKNFSEYIQVLIKEDLKKEP